VERAQLLETFHTYGSKATGVDSDTTEACAILNQQAFQSEASNNHGVQRGFGDERELLKFREVKRLDGGLEPGVGSVAVQMVQGA
jgi:hypothetical protein